MNRIMMILGAVLALLMSACNLSGTSVSSVTTAPIATSTPVQATQTDVPSPTQQLSQTATPFESTGCVPRTDWPTYTIQSGDTLFSILQISRTGLSIDELAAANCLDDPNNLSVGQQIYVPNAIKTGDLLVYWINTSLHTNPRRDNSIVGACDNLISPITSEVAATSDVALNLRNRLELLFNGTGENASGWSGKGLSVATIDFENGRAIIQITGDFLFPGHCGDGALENEIMFTLFSEESVQSIQIFIGDRNLRQIIDLSGLAGSDYIYTRDYLPPDW